MNNYFLLFNIILLFNCFIGVYTKNTKNVNYIVAILRKKNDKNYDDVNQEIQNEIDEFVNDKMNDIYNVIEEHQDSYILNNGEQDKNLNELNSFPLKKRSDKTKKFYFINDIRKNRKNFEEFSSKFSKRSNNSMVEYIPFKSSLVNHICPISNFYTISVYLSEETAKIVCNMENVLFCEKNKKYSLKSKSKRINNFNNYNSTSTANTNNYYDINAIKNETKWSDVSVQQISYSPNHLSLISQSPFIDPSKQIDTNFYYPSSAGKGIDIYFIDIGLSNNHEDFNRYEGTSDERIITCDAIITENNVHFTTGDEKNNCSAINGYPDHGIMVSSMAGGTIYGVAKKANLHMIAFDDTYINALRAFDIILQNGKPHKTVISISTGYIDAYSKAEKYKLNDLINKGFIVIIATGNESTNCCGDNTSPNFYSYAGYRKAISVGATDTELNGFGYTVASYSNYGDCVDIYAPGTVTYPVLEDDSITEIGEKKGTSCSTPLVAGVAASIMSEHPEIEFDNELMRKTLIEMSIKDAIDFKNLDTKNDTPNRFINNGKQRIYYPEIKNVQCGRKPLNTTDGNGNGNICYDGCCTKEGECISFENHPGDKCFIENGCQSEFGYCTTLEKSLEECEKELKENEDCLIEITYSENEKKDIANQCKIFNSQKCQKFYQKQLSDQSICSIVKKNKKIEFINNFDINKYNKNSQSCIKLFSDDRNKCEEYINEKFNECKIYKYFYEEYIGYEENTENIEDDYNKFNEDNYFIQNCINIKQNTCQMVYKNKKEEIKEEILSNSSCLNLYENGFTDILDISNVIEKNNRDKGIIDFSRKSYAKIEEKCDTVLDKDLILKNCDRELENYEKCFIDDPKRLTTDEIVENCYIYKYECEYLYNYTKEALANCYFSQQFQTIEALDKIKEINSSYKELCSSSEVKEKIISNCKNILQNVDEYLFDVHSEMTFEEASQKCEKFKIGEQNYENLMENNDCIFEQEYNRKDSLIKKYDLKFTQIRDFCLKINDKDDQNKYISDCEHLLNIYNEKCDFSQTPNDDGNDLDNKCEIFLECQEIYENPFKSMDECRYAQWFKNIEIKFNISDENYTLYKEKCLPNNSNITLKYVDISNTTNSNTSIVQTVTTTSIISTTPTIPKSTSTNTSINNSNSKYIINKKINVCYGNKNKITITANKTKKIIKKYITMKKK